MPVFILELIKSPIVNVVIRVHSTNAIIAIKPTFHSLSGLKAAIMPKTVQIIRFIKAEYLNEVKSNLSSLFILFFATIAPSHNEKMKDMTSPEMALAKVANIIKVKSPSPENIEGKNNVNATMPSPNGKPIRYELSKLNFNPLSIGVIKNCSYGLVYEQ